MIGGGSRRRRAGSLAPHLLALVSTAALAQTPSPGTAPGRHRPTTPLYAASVRTWHTPPPDARPPLDDLGHPMLVLSALNTTDRATLAAANDGGGFSASDLDRAAVVLRDPSTGARHPVEPRLLDIVFRVQSHFAAAEIRVLSGYRVPSRGRASNHGKGRAMDLVVPGTSDADVAAYARGLGFVGVGIYPVSGFVHVDVRDRSYFWSDASGPGRKNRERGILGPLALASDRDAASRGEAVVATCSLQFDVDAALRACVSRDAPVDDDDDASD
jgi:uncharacterized protein YcbK (DUF882 family)